MDVTGTLARIVQGIGYLIGLLLAALAWPFRAFGRWLRTRGWLVKVPVTAIVVLIVGLYAYFFWTTQVWRGFDPDYPTQYAFQEPAANVSQPAAASDPQPAVEGETRTCTRSGIVDVSAGLIDFNVDQNPWVSSMILYKLRLFGLDWERTPYFDNKAAFQRGVNQVLRRTTVELVDALGRIRGTSQIDQSLQDARGALQFDESTWYFGLSPFGPKTPTPSFYRTAARELRAFNDRMASCQAQFDARADNLVQFVDRVANDLGATSAIIRDRSENYDGGWFDARADDRYWFAYGQLYGYYGVLVAARHDFGAVVEARGLSPLWAELEAQTRAALAIQPAIISNGREDGWIMPTHLATMGFYILRVRSNLVEIRAVLDR